jgi:hypothetical protein
MRILKHNCRERLISLNGVEYSQCLLPFLDSVEESWAMTDCLQLIPATVYVDLIFPSPARFSLHGRTDGKQKDIFNML